MWITQSVVTEEVGSEKRVHHRVFEHPKPTHANQNTSRSRGMVFPTPYSGCVFVCCMAGFCCVVQTGLELTVILWLQPLKYQDYRHKLSYLLELGATVSTSYGRLVLAEPLLSSELPSLSRSMLSKVAMTYERLTAAHSCY